MIVQKAELNVSSAANGCPYAEGLFQETGLAQMPMKMVSGGSGGGRRVGWTRAASPPPTTMSSSSSSSLVTIRRGQCCLRRPPVGRDSPAEPDCWALAMVNVAELLALRAVCPLSTGLSNEMKTEEEERQERSEQRAIGAPPPAISFSSNDWQKLFRADRAP
ncbi:hypothetical protein T05_14968 [Trichinella murrelli]|uniref:Uncharacterized protein n=1 Tax=Trichinella murrelli TaxID=144512 RepID=A0A0V0UH06_9BILA|nr:hypothetical protein T05_14968 [Trichinella murrelli]